MKSVFFSLAFLFATSCFAEMANGGSDVGGGMGVVCRTPDGQIKSVELLDLWEARNIYQREVPQNTLAPETQLTQVIDKLQYIFPYTPDSTYSRDTNYVTKINLTLIGNRFFDVPDSSVHRLRNVTLKKTKDSLEVVIPNDCKIEQIVRYNGYNGWGEVYLNQDLIDHMDATNQAALYAHEALYTILRPIEKTSLRIRRMIGFAFSSDDFFFTEKKAPEYYYDCQGGQIGVDESRILMEWDGTRWSFQTLAVAGYRPFWGISLPLNPTFDPLVGSKEIYFDRFSSEYIYKTDFDLTSTSPEISISLKSVPRQSKFKTIKLNCSYKGKVQ